MRRMLLGVALLALVVVLVVSFLMPAPSESVLQLLAPVPNREFGILETLQHVLLVLLVVFVLLKTWTAARGTRLLLSAAGLFFAFVFLEEVDYFLHFYDAFQGREVYATNLHGLRNAHNAPALGSAQNLASVLLGLVSWLLGAYRLVGAPGGPAVRRSLPWSAAALAVLVLTAGPVAVESGLIYSEDVRQVPSELAELALYSSWALMLSLSEPAPSWRRRDGRVGVP
jgi:uncharacterized membrane protein YozB (DUF420 family)